MKNSKVEKICYVCGFELDDYPYEPKTFSPNPEVICSCCGTHYGLDDEGGGKVEILDETIDMYNNFGDNAHKKIITILRKRWIDNGMTWWFNPAPELIVKYSDVHPTGGRPYNWNPIKQLKNIPEEFMDDETRRLIENSNAKKGNSTSFLPANALRGKLLNQAGNDVNLQRLVNDIYRPMKEGAIKYGDGSSIDAAIHEAMTGMKIGGKSHFIKLNETLVKSTDGKSYTIKTSYPKKKTSNK